MACNIFTQLIVVTLSLFVNCKASTNITDGRIPISSGVVNNTKLQEYKGDILESWKPDPQIDTRKRSKPLNYKKDSFETILDEILAEKAQHNRGPTSTRHKTEEKNRELHAKISQSSNKNQSNEYYIGQPIMPLDNFEIDRINSSHPIGIIKYKSDKDVYYYQPVPISNINDKRVHSQPTKPIKYENDYKELITIRQQIKTIYYDENKEDFDYRGQQLQPINIYYKDKKKARTTKEEHLLHNRFHRTTETTSTENRRKYSDAPTKYIEKHENRIQQVLPINIHHNAKKEARTTKEQHLVHNRSHSTTETTSTEDRSTSRRHSDAPKKYTEKHKNRIQQVVPIDIHHKNKKEARTTKEHHLLHNHSHKTTETTSTEDRRTSRKHSEAPNKYIGKHKNRDKKEARTTKEQHLLHNRSHRTTETTSTQNRRTSRKHSDTPKKYIKKHKNRNHSKKKPKKHKSVTNVARAVENEADNTAQHLRSTQMYQMQEKEDGEKKEGGDEGEHKEPHEEEDKAKHEGGQEKERPERFILSVYSIADQFKKLIKGFPGVEVNSTIVGLTASYNKILLLKISKKCKKKLRHDDKYDNDDMEKKIIFIVHALTPMGLNNLYSLTIENYLKKLLSFYFKHLDKFDIFLMPLANPDGYAMGKNTWQQWNKNVSPQDECPGVDVDRNFDVAWNDSEKLSSCDMHYPGTTPFSEPESRAVRDIFHQYSHKLVGYFHVHAGTHDHNTFKGDAVLYPRGFTDSSANDDKYIEIRGDIEETMKNGSFKTLSVTVDTLYNWYGLVRGASVDYASTVYGIPYAMELVMQVYQNPTAIHVTRLTTGVVDELELKALNEIWGRVIDAIFKNIYRKLDANNNDQRHR